MSFEHDELILQKITVDKILASLSDEHREILQLWMSGAFTLEEIGRVIGQKYHGKDLKPSVIRYHRNKILTMLQSKFGKL